jgi:hypothetical protein
MKTRAKVWVIAIGCLVAAGLIVDVWFPVNLVSIEVEARVGRPMTPGSVAGVARRTTHRRTIMLSVWRDLLSGSRHTVCASVC